MEKKTGYDSDDNVGAEVDTVIDLMKSRGLFDQFRKACLEDVDTKPAYLQMKRRIEDCAQTYLKRCMWNPQNKIQQREGLRAHVASAHFLHSGINHIVDQAVNYQRIQQMIQPEVERITCEHLGLPSIPARTSNRTTDESQRNYFGMPYPCPSYFVPTPPLQIHLPQSQQSLRHHSRYLPNRRPQYERRAAVSPLHSRKSGHMPSRNHQPYRHITDSRAAHGDRDTSSVSEDSFEIDMEIENSVEVKEDILIEEEQVVNDGNFQHLPQVAESHHFSPNPSKNTNKNALSHEKSFLTPDIK